MHVSLHVCMSHLESDWSMYLNIILLACLNWMILLCTIAIGISSLVSLASYKWRILAYHIWNVWYRLCFHLLKTNIWLAIFIKHQWIQVRKTFLHYNIYNLGWHDGVGIFTLLGKPSYLIPHSSNYTYSNPQERGT